MRVHRLSFVVLVVVFLCSVRLGKAQTLADNPEGAVRVVGNELLTDAKIDDAAAVRLGAPETQGGLGKVSYDVLGVSRKEMIALIGAQSPGHGGEWSINLLKPGGISIDADMVKAMYVNHEDGFRFTLPVYAPNLGAGAGGAVLISPDGMYHTYQQNDGNLVTYKVKPPDAEHTTEWLLPMWSSWHGVIQPHPWEQR